MRNIINEKSLREQIRGKNRETRRRMTKTRKVIIIFALSSS
jgi:hypothetical protein